MGREELLALPAVVDVPTAARALGLSRTAAYELVRNDDWPTPIIRVGRLIKIPTDPILKLLGIERDRPQPNVPAPRRPDHDKELP